MLACLLWLIAFVTGQLSAQSDVGDGLTRPPEFSVVARAHRGFTVTVSDLRTNAIERGAEPGSAREVLLDVTIENSIDPELVFDAGIDEAITLHGFAVSGPYLLVNGQHIATLDDRREPTDNELPDPLTLPYSGDRVDGRLRFALPVDSVLDSASLLVPHALFGPLELPLLGTRADDVRPDEFVNGALSVGIEQLQVSAEGVELVLAGSGGRPVDSAAVEPGTISPVNVSGLRLFIPGEGPIEPAGIADGLSPIVFAPGATLRHRIAFATPLANDAASLALVLPVPPPRAQAGEPYWIVPLRGEPPSLAALAQPPAPPGTPASSADGGAVVDYRTPDADAALVVHAPALPEPPALQLSREAHLNDLRARYERLVASQPQPTDVLSAIDADTPPLSVGERRLALFDGKDRRHTHRLPVSQDPAALFWIDVRTEDGAPVTLRLQAEGQDAGLALKQRDAGEPLSRLRLAEPLLLQVQSRDAGVAYEIVVGEDAPLREGELHEPSDTPVEALLPRFEIALDAPGRDAFGYFDSPRDVDHLLLDTGEPMLATIEVVPAGSLSLYAGTREVARSAARQSRSFLHDVLLPAGTTLISVRSDGTRRLGDYALRVTPYALPPLGHELEPNDDASQAHRLVPGGSRTGRLPSNGDRDLYFFDWPGRAMAQLQLQTEQADTLALRISTRTGLLAPTRNDAGHVVFDLEAGHYTVDVHQRGGELTDYTLSLAFADPAVVEPVSPTGHPVLLAVDTAPGVLTAFSRHAQRLPFAVSIENRSTAAQQIALRARATNDCCETTVASPELTLEPGERRRVPMAVRVRRDQVIQTTFPVFVESRDAVSDDALSETLRVDVQVMADAPEQPERWQDRPPGAASPGSWDMARTDLGAYPHESLECRCKAGARIGTLFGSDPYTPDSSPCAAAVHAGVISQAEGGVLRIETRRGGSNFPASEAHGVASRERSEHEPVGIAPVGIDAASQATLSECPANASQLTRALTLYDGVPSSDIFRGDSTTVALAGDRSVPIASVLVSTGLRTSVHAVTEVGLSFSDDGEDYGPEQRHALDPGQLYTALTLSQPITARFVRTRFLASSGNTRPGGFELSGIKVLSDASDAGPYPQGVNLAIRRHGGHVFQQGDGTLVISFHHKRIARIGSLRLRNDATLTHDEVRVSVSTDGPFGPYRSLGSLSLGAGADGGIELPEPVSARYLRFASDTSLDEVSLIEAIEVPSDADYRSILTEWGAESSAAWHEWMASPAESVSEVAIASSSDEPIEATPGDRFAGSVSLAGAREQIYRIAMPDDGDSLELAFAGDPYLRARIELTDQRGEPIEASVERSAARQTETHTILPTPSLEAVTVRVHDATRHLAVLWDDSGSVAAFIRSMEKMMRSLPFELDSEHVKVRLGPLQNSDHAFLDNGWTSDPYDVVAAMRRYRTTGSSAVYSSLGHALDELSEVDGIRAVLVLADAQGDRNRYPDAEIEKKIATVAPTVFSFQVTTSEDIHEAQTDHMQDWAMIAGGHHVQIRDPADLTLAFARVQAWLRRPTGYTMAVTQQRVGPGQLQVLAEQGGEAPSGVGDVAGGTAIEVIVDASGSMWKRLSDGRTRIDVARDVLRDLVERTLPERVPFALRVFGHREARSCRTDLELALAPLERDQALATIASIEPQDRSRTPIADSLASVATDLDTATGRRIVVLVTDGEETCDGDPEAEIERLVAAGIQVQVNIVGLAIDDEALKADFRRWAETGGGDYFDADSAATLAASLATSLEPRFEVIDASGRRVASGRVGAAAIDLPAGHYTVHLQGSDDATEVTVVTGRSTSVALR